MRLVSYIGPDGAGTAVLADDRLIPLIDGWLEATDLEPEALDDLRHRADALQGAVGIALDDVELIAPFPDAGKIVCVGLNYREHVAEGGRPAPARPLLFSKFANAVIGDGEPIIRPDGSHALDLEVELGVVIGSTARRVPRDEALECVAGYVVVNDISARDWQGVPAALAEGEVGDGQWLRAKGSDTFLPMGSVFVTADEIPDPQALRLWSWVIPGAAGATGDKRPGLRAGRETLMQEGTTADMIWGVAELIEYISRSITLEPGDIIATGTPSGVGIFRDPPILLQPGDRVRCEIEGICSMENPVTEWSDESVESVDPDEADEPAGD
jgi:2-keto-4-pentenoate hydratase/2-oxohepta-3-ene-1,7-dioic acid hydratase in catechol pathway